MSHREIAWTGATGFVMGLVLSRIGFTSWDEVHRMFTFEDLRLLFAFMLAVGLLAVAWAVIRRVSAPRWAPRSLHKGTLVGGLLFGAGWALSGACPSIALVSIGEGQLGALVTLGGILAGNWLYGVVNARWLHWGTESCANDG